MYIFIFEGFQDPTIFHYSHFVQFIYSRPPGGTTYACFLDFAFFLIQTMRFLIVFRVDFQSGDPSPARTAAVRILGGDRAFPEIMHKTSSSSSSYIYIYIFR